jgi:sugar lactone lactonase YvrE
MLSKPSSASEVQTLLADLAMGESPRWHDNRLWFSDWGAQEIVAVDLDGRSEVTVLPQFGLPFCIDWLLDGRLLIGFRLCPTDLRLSLFKSRNNYASDANRGCETFLR